MPGDLKRIEAATAKIRIEGEHYAPQQMAMTGG
jgi:hypothetical protein